MNTLLFVLLISHSLLCGGIIGWFNFRKEYKFSLEQGLNRCQKMWLSLDASIVTGFWGSCLSFIIFLGMLARIQEHFLC